MWRWLEKVYKDALRTLGIGRKKKNRFTVDAVPGMVLENYPKGSTITVKGYVYPESRVGPWYRKGSADHPAREGVFIEFVLDNLPWMNRFVRADGKGGVYGDQPSVDLYNEVDNWPRGIDAWERRYSEDPTGAWHDQVWPPAHITAKGLERCRVIVEDTVRAPAEIFFAEGCIDCIFEVNGTEANNVILHSDRGGARERGGSNNTYKLNITARGVGLRVDDTSDPAIAKGGSIGAMACLADLGAIDALGRLAPGQVNVLGVKIYALPREYPLPKHGTRTWFHVGIYWDDFASGNLAEDCEIEGFACGIFVHGGSYNVMNHITTLGIPKPVAISPAHWKDEYEGVYHQIPEGNEISNITADVAQVLWEDPWIGEVEKPL